MILTQTLASLSLAVCLGGNNVQALKPEQIQKITGPMAQFERLTSGEWRMKSVGGSEFFETWRYGPGGHSVRKFTHGVNLHDNNRPWREVEVFFWNPIEKKVNLIGFSPFMSGVGRGSIDLKPSRFESRFELNQGGDIRKLGHEIAFQGEDKFQETLYESVNGQPYVVGNQWNHVWSKAITPVPVLNSPETPKPTGAQAFLAGFVGKAWQGKNESNRSLAQRTDFEWIPYANVMNIRSSMQQGQGSSIGQYDIYLYQIPSAPGVKAFALFKDGTFAEGAATAVDSGKIEIRLKMSTNQKADKIITYVTDSRNSLIEEAWNLSQGKKTLAWKSVSAPAKSSSR